MESCSRRNFIRSTALGAITVSLFNGLSCTGMKEKNETDARFKISLAEWSLHNAIFSGQLDHLDFTKKAASFGIHAVEYVSQFFKDKVADAMYLAEMNKRASDAGVKQLLIMVDGEGGLAEPDEKLRNETVDNHRKWVDAAKTLGCHSIRVNLFGSTLNRKDMHIAAVDGLSNLCVYAIPLGINIIVENHGGLSSDGQWLSGVIDEVALSNCGTLPDFGNFCIEREGGVWNGEVPCIKVYDKYRGVEELMPHAKAVSAKSYDFDAKGNETTIDYSKMMDIIKRSSYSGYIGIEYEGSRLSEDEGIIATKKLLEKLITV